MTILILLEQKNAMDQKKVGDPNLDLGIKLALESVAILLMN